jgi:DNA-binding PadR family transcriptional regulator
MARTRTGPTPAELALLGLLAEGPAHPYSLDSKLRHGGSSTEVAFSSIYAALDRLEKLGLVTSKPDAGARGKARRVYKLTATGRGALKMAARTALAKPLSGARPNDLGVANLALLTRADALAAVGEARKSLSDEKKLKANDDDHYPQSALALHRGIILAAEEKFYAELEKLVMKAHPERSRKKGEDEAE